MDKREGIGMEKLTIDQELTTHIGIQTFVTIGSISDDRMTDMCHMYTDLMGTTRFDTTLEEGECRSKCTV
jgi:hypothetical protein